MKRFRYKLFPALLFTAIFSLNCSETSAQNFLIPYRKGTLWGYADPTGKIIVPPQFEKVSSDGDNRRWVVSNNDKLGVIDEKGELILNTEYEKIKRDPKHSEYNDYYIFKNGKAGYATWSGKIMLPAIYDTIRLCSFPDNLHHSYGYYFLVKQNSDWTIIDSNQQVILSSIQTFRDLYDGDYFLKIKDHWGIYSVTNKSWYFKPDYDTIGYLKKYDLDLKPEFKDYIIYAQKGNELFLINTDAELKSFGSQILDSLYEPQKIMDLEIYDMPVEDNYNDTKRTLTSLRNLVQTDENGIQVLIQEKRYAPLITELILTQKSGNLGVNVIYDGKKIQISPEYNDIHVFYGDGSLNENYLFVQKNAGWGIYSLYENKLVVPSEMDSIKQSYNPLVYELWKNNRCGIYVQRYQNEESGYYIPPQFDEFYELSSVPSHSGEYAYFTLFMFTLEGQLCIVGENGVHFYSEQ